MSRVFGYAELQQRPVIRSVAQRWVAAIDEQVDRLQDFMAAHPLHQAIAATVAGGLIMAVVLAII